MIFTHCFSFAKWNFIMAVSGCTVPWKTISFSCVIFFKSKVKEINSFPHLNFCLHPSMISLAGKIPPKSIVSAKTVQELFTPTLPESALKSLESTLSFFGIPAGNQWGTALALRTEDWPGQRKKGSAYCMSHSFFFLLLMLDYTTPLMCLLLYCRVWLGWNFRIYRSRDGHCCHICDTGCTLDG